MLGSRPANRGVFTSQTLSKMDSICPFTLKPLNKTNREDLAFICQGVPQPSSTDEQCDGTDNDAATKNLCGHCCTMSQLVAYLHGSSGGSTKPSCPVCQAPASIVCDANSFRFLTQQCKPNENASDEGRVISFRYGTVSYYLWVKSSPLSYSKFFSYGRRQNAIDRIACVLSMNLRSMRIINKGKIIYPDTSKGTNSVSVDDISEQLLDISSADLIHRRKKPSLIVMGLRQPTTAAVGYYGLAMNVLLSIAKRLTPWHLFNMATWAIQCTFRATVSLMGAISLFVRSLLYPPPSTQQ